MRRPDEPAAPAWSVVPLRAESRDGERGGSRRLEVRDLLDEQGHAPRKALGQHYLTSRDHLERIADAIAAAARPRGPLTGGAAAGGPPATVLEIGAGPGNLTAALLGLGLPVWAVELDRSVAPIHQKVFAADLAAGRLHVEYGDALRAEAGRVLAWGEGRGAAPGALVVAGNIPYAITSPLVFRALDWMLAGIDVRAVVFLMQRDVAERAVAGPGSRAFGVLGAKLAMIARARILFGVPAGAFWPVPKVESAVLEVVPRPAAERPAPEEMAAAWRLLERAFQHRRKMMAPTLAAGDRARRAAIEGWLAGEGLSPMARPEEVGAEGWLALARRLGGRD